MCFCHFRITSEHDDGMFLSTVRSLIRDPYFGASVLINSVFDTVLSCQIQLCYTSIDDTHIHTQLSTTIVMTMAVRFVDFFQHCDSLLYHFQYFHLQC